MTTNAQLEHALRKLDVKVVAAREVRINSQGELEMKLDCQKLSFEDSPIQIQVKFDKDDTFLFLDDLHQTWQEHCKRKLEARQA